MPDFRWVNDEWKVDEWMMKTMLWWGGGGGGGDDVVDDDDDVTETMNMRRNWCDVFDDDDAARQSPTPNNEGLDFPPEQKHSEHPSPHLP